MRGLTPDSVRGLRIKFPGSVYTEVGKKSDSLSASSGSRKGDCEEPTETDCGAPRAQRGRLTGCVNASTR